jgi:hypothetical protein
VWQLSRLLLLLLPPPPPLALLLLLLLLPLRPTLVEKRVVAFAVRATILTY